jgi:hypothetical protein
MCAGEISIQRQRLFTFGDALGRALGPYVDNSQLQMRSRVVQGRGQSLGQLRFGCREGRHGIGRKEIYARQRVRSRRSNERLDIVGIGGERAIEKAARLRHIVRDQTLIEPGQPLKIEVHRVRVRSPFRPSRLGGDELGVQRAGQTRHDFILHIEEIGKRLVEPLEMAIPARTRRLESRRPSPA